MTNQSIAIVWIGYGDHLPHFMVDPRAGNWSAELRRAELFKCGKDAVAYVLQFAQKHGATSNVTLAVVSVDAAGKRELVGIL